MTDFEKTFDNAALVYEASRPDYPEALYSDIFRYAPIADDRDVLEIGLGTGKATLPMLHTGCRLVGLEPGEQLAALAWRKLGGHPNLSLHLRTLQDYCCPPETFDLIYSATAFHWIPEEYGYARVFELLKRGGAFARFAYHAGPDKGREGLVKDIQQLYGEHMGETEPPKEFGDENAEALAAIAERYGFVDTEYHLYHITKDFSADEYIGLLQTYPNHMALEAQARQRLFDGIHSAINSHGGRITVYYTVDLELARKP